MQLQNVNIVMVETTHPGNIGAAARAMKNMGLTRLTLVNPKCPVGDRAYARASGANDVLDERITVTSLTEAIGDCQLVVGTSARLRSLAWPQLDPESVAQKVAAMPHDQRVALVFGREHSGLTNDELQHCHYSVTIPTHPGFSSLNVASAIQVIAYEIYKLLQQFDADTTRQQQEPPADSGEMEGYFSHLEQVLVSTGFLDPENPRHMMKRLRRLFQRAQPSKNEINILRGILTAVQKYKNT